ncbi:MAG TPA: hypothetical protein VL285_09085 [Bryobacteraceae bacterium]|nr:hypothetical protein [Bryobacteraceae bacterium]
MPETLQKLRPDRDLQCYFLRPSAIAAMSQASATGYTVSGGWRQQFDWAVIEWNRDNTFEHPLLRNLPDGDLSGVQLTYDETRENCILLDSTLYHTVDWPYLRVWAESGGSEQVYFVPLKAHATPIEGSYVPASTTFTLGGSPTVNDYVELSWLNEHYYHQMTSADSLASAVHALSDTINALSPTMAASYDGSELTITFLGESSTPGTRETPAASTTGTNGNLLGAYTSVSGAKTESWSHSSRYLSGGTSPSKWRVVLNFGSLSGYLVSTPGPGDSLETVPTNSVRKMRWTYAAGFQIGAYQKSEFQVTTSNWTVTGTDLAYQVAGSQSRRVEDDSTDLSYSAGWSQSRGNFSGGSIHYTTLNGRAVSYTYTAPQNHRLYLGTRKAAGCPEITITVDSQSRTENLAIAGEDSLVRVHLGEMAGGVAHTVTVTHAGSDGSYFYFDFFEIAVPAVNLPEPPSNARLTLATDWDTDHSVALPAERTAWLIKSLGFEGRANHYVGALLFYELTPQGFGYASGTVTFTGTPIFSEITEVSVGLDGSVATLQHVNLVTDDAASVAKAFELIINNGYTGIRAEASGTVLTLFARAMGEAGNSISLSASVLAADPETETFFATSSGENFTGGADGVWRTDLDATPRINRAARDWSRSFFSALRSYGIDVAAAFSMELQHGDPSPEAGIAQRYHDGEAVLLTTPALQTNFSPTSLAFWKQVYADMAGLMADAGCVPYLQFGEVQWWYFVWDRDSNTPHDSLPFYDAFTTSTFTATYGGAMHVFTNTAEDPAAYPEEAAFLPGLIGSFTDQIITFVRGTYPNTRFEVLYPPDVNDFPLTRVINLPAQWTPATLDCLKTENFTYTGLRNMNHAKNSIRLPMDLGFPANRASHLVGIGDYTTPWLRESRASLAEGVESVVLFALDQFCLIGYPAPLERSSRRCAFMGTVEL